MFGPDGEPLRDSADLTHTDIDLRLHIARLFEQQRELIEGKVLKTEANIAQLETAAIMNSDWRRK